MEGARLYVGNLKYSVTEQELQELFSAHGVVKQITVIPGKGFSFVEMSSSSDAEKAKDALNGQDFQGRTLRIDEARPPKEKSDNGFRPRRDRSGY